MKHKELAIWLKAILIITLFVTLVLAFLIAPWIGKSFVHLNPELEYMYLPCLVFLWFSGLVFIIGIYYCFLICIDIGKDRSFSQNNAKRFKIISRLALFDTILYVLGSFTLFAMNLLHPSILLFMLFIVFIGICLTIATAVLSHLVAKANNLEQENNLTI